MSHDDSTDAAFQSTLNTDHLHVQLNNYDFYMTKPRNLDTKHGNSLPMNEFLKVPVIRVYGNLPTGHQVLCHIHGVFPYLFIPYDGQNTDESVVINQKCATLHKCLERWCCTSIPRKNKNKEGIKNKNDGFSNKLEYIANVSLVKGVPFYGFHVGWSLFYKISLLDAGITNKLSDGIRGGVVFDKKIDCYESQLPYLLQFTVDFNLFCCSWIEIEKCYFRAPILNSTLEMDKILYTEELEKLIAQFCDIESNVLSEKEYPKNGNALIEIDILPQFIMNIEELEFREIHHDLIELLQETSKIFGKPYVSSTKNIMKDLKLQRNILSLDTYSTATPIERFSINNKWQSSATNNENLHAALHRTSTKNFSPDCTSSFIENNTFFQKINTPKKALTELWPSIPQIALIKEVFGAEKDLIDTMDNNYSVAEISEDEGFDDEDSDDSFYMRIEADKENERVMEGNIDSFKRATTDSFMTQTMTKKKRATQKDLANQSSIVNKRKSSSFRDGIKYKNRCFIYKKCDYEFNNLLEDLEDEGFPKIDYLDPYFSNPLDLRERPYIYAGKRFEITSTHLFSRIPVPFEDENIIMTTKQKESVFSSWKYLKKPPTYSQVKQNIKLVKKKQYSHSNIENPASTHGKYYISGKKHGELRRSYNKAPIKNELTHFSMEIHVQTSGSQLPDPLKDEVQMICWCLENESYPFDLDISFEGIMVVKNSEGGASFISMVQNAAGSTPVAFYDDEFDLFDALIDLVLIFDPDILSGFEVHNSSWGYIIERSRKFHRFEMTEQLSRIKFNTNNKLNDAWGYSHASAIMIPGRHIINIWRALKSELNLTQYTMENICSEVLNERLPHFSFVALSKMWKDYKNISSIRTVIQYWFIRCKMNIDLLQKQEYIPRITEQARLTGIDFYSVYYRGSQYKIESILSRICKSECFLLLSPSRMQVRKQKALECVPLVMEPESGFYKSPLVVLDFQSLYPSVMIAYNYCFSTLIGRVRDLNVLNNEIGVTNISLKPNLLSVLRDHITLSPNGVAYVDSKVRKSSLAKMLEDILDTRFMVKKTMSDIGNRNIPLKRILNSRQLALKLIANVTYGYASASFSGRMPCSDLADSIVQTGREILEKAIDFIEANREWGAKVVYGDTDSLFVYLPGKTKEEAFTIGNEMAKSITSQNRAPIYLNFEKIYYPCLLLSKKRYVGYKYEHVSSISPVFDAKGIETVRRDGHPAQQKITERCLRLLFETKDLSKIKKYVQDEFKKIHAGRMLVQDFCFAKEVKLGAYKSEKTAPPGAVVATRQIEKDHRAKPQYKERVPYLVVRNSPGTLLRERCVSLNEFFQNDCFELDSEYYINKTLVPPLERIFNVLGISIAEWAFEVPRSINAQIKIDKNKISNPVISLSCANCKRTNIESNDNLCPSCLQNYHNTVAKLTLQRLKKENRLTKIATVCRVCCYRYTREANSKTASISDSCISYDCPVFYERTKLKRYYNSAAYQNLNKALDSINEW